MSFNFKCEQCGKCCNFGGVVHLFPEDYFKIKKGLNLTNKKESLTNYFRFIIEEFHLIDYTCKIPRLSTNKLNKGCIFLKNNLCSIHNFKPMICETAPFNRTLLIVNENRNLFKETCKPFSLIKSLPENIEDLNGVKTEIIYENDYFDQLKKNSFKEIFEIGFDIDWITMTYHINKKTDEVWHFNNIDLLTIYEKSIG